MMKVVYSFLLLWRICAAQNVGTAAPVAAPVAAPTAPIPFTTTEELYNAVDDYLLGGGVNTTTSALTYGFPIGSWDVSQLTNFSAVFDPKRYSLFDDFDMEVRSMPYGVSNWDVSNALDMSRMFRATTFNGNLTVSIIVDPFVKAAVIIDLWHLKNLSSSLPPDLEFKSFQSHQYEGHVPLCSELSGNRARKLAGLERPRLLLHVRLCRAI